MKYLEQYLEEKIKIKVLGKLTTTETSSGEEVGVSLVIDGYEPGIEVWYADYCAWLEKKIEDAECDILREENSKQKVSIESVKQWLDKEFYVKNTNRLDDLGNCLDIVTSEFESKEEMFESFFDAINDI